MTIGARTRSLALLGLAVLVMACSTGAAATPPPSLDGTAWRAVEIDGVVVTGIKSPTLQFMTGRIRADGGCNTFSGTFSLEGDTIDFGDFSATLRLCEGAAGETETRFLRALIGATTVSFDAAGDLLVTGETVSLRFERS